MKHFYQNQFCGLARFAALISSVVFILGVIIAFSRCSRGSTPGPGVTPSEISVGDLGAVGDGTTDDTYAFQRAVDSMASIGGGTVTVPQGRYLINPDSSIQMKSNVNLVLEDSTTTLMAKASTQPEGRFYVILVLGVTDVNISGGKIIGESDKHQDALGEHGMGIAIYGSSRVQVSNMYITNCWGDGITMGTNHSWAPLPTEDITIKNVVCDNNRRQGLTIGLAKNIIVDSCRFINTGQLYGTKPMDGIDIEPDGDTDTAQNIMITNCEMAYNKANGVEMNAELNSKPDTRIQHVEIHNCNMHDNNYAGYINSSQYITINNNYIYANRFNMNTIHAGGDTLQCILTPNVPHAP